MMQFGQMSHEQNGHLIPPSGSGKRAQPPRCCFGTGSEPFVVTATEMVSGQWRDVPGQGPSSRLGSPCQPPPAYARACGFSHPCRIRERREVGPSAPCPGLPHGLGSRETPAERAVLGAPRGREASPGPGDPREATKSPSPEATHQHSPRCPVSPCSSSPPPRGTLWQHRSPGPWHPPVPSLEWPDQEFSAASLPSLPSLGKIWPCPHPATHLPATGARGGLEEPSPHSGKVYQHPSFPASRLPLDQLLHEKGWVTSLLVVMTPARWA